MNGDEEGRREEARQEKEVRPINSTCDRKAFCREGGDLSGDEEEASRQEGCPEEKEVTLYKWLRWGRHPPAGLIIYFIWLELVKRKNYIYFCHLFSDSCVPYVMNLVHFA